MDQNKLVETDIWRMLQNIKDPEIASVSILDLGMIHSVHFYNGKAEITALPTFSGCPALDIIKSNIENTLLTLEAVQRVHVKFIYDPPWTSDRITPEGRERLKEFGIAPPPLYFEKDGIWSIDCPYCDSNYTTVENIFGPTSCRSIFYCKSCKNPFEAMKPISILL
ncbi:1,2-phenylacetyl-CoA epoxidase subunit PaaD [Peribacillus sp. SCS-155]|uniref:1,2-phenylacetyl-CoA epoxidase subunit PaaD n=1 Tax=Peribacillus sedimenti TaxID=3115297 RepID=UPI003906C12B